MSEPQDALGVAVRDLLPVAVAERGALRPGTVSDSTWTSMPAASISGSRNSVKSGSLRAQSASERRLNRFAGQGGG
jgi:hypothetical protein